MKFYKRWMGAFARKTGHLTLTEKGAYNALLDHYYSIMRPLPADMPTLFRIAGAQDETERRAVTTVVDEFFPVLSDGLRHNERADEEIIAWQEQAETNRKTARDREAKKRGATS